MPPLRATGAGALAPTGLNPGGTGGIAGAPGGTCTRMADATAVPSTAGQSAATDTPSGGVVADAASVPVSTTRYSKRPRAAVGRGMSAVHSPSRAVMATVYQSDCGPARNPTSPAATASAGTPRAEMRT